MRYHRIPLEFLATPEWDELTDIPAIEYEVRPYQPSAGRSAQPILAGRDILVPQLDLDDYHCSAVIDWLEVDLATPGRHQALNVQRFATGVLRRLGSRSKVFVKGPERRAPYLGDQFVLRLQEPEPRVLRYFLKDLNAHYAPDRHPTRDTRILGIEISIDFRVKRAGEISRDRRNLLRWQIVDVLRRHLRPEAVLTEAPGCAPRFFATRGGQPHAQYILDMHAGLPKAIMGEIDRLGLEKGTAHVFGMKAHHRVPVDTTTYIGSAEFPVLLRVMDKRTDRRDPDAATVHALEEPDWRGRIEVSLPETTQWESSAEPLGLQKVNDLYGFDYQSIRRYFFEFYLPTLGGPEVFDCLPVPISLTEIDVFDRSGVYGLDRLHRALQEVERERYSRREISDKPLTLGKKGRLVSYITLNQKVDRALRGLSRDWERAKHPISLAHSAARK